MLLGGQRSRDCFFSWNFGEFLPPPPALAMALSYRNSGPVFIRVSVPASVGCHGGCSWGGNFNSL